MSHTSVPVTSAIELVDIAPSSISPLVSKCFVKVCYVSDQPNRNGSVITKETAIKMAPSLRGAVIVGHYNKEKDDFETHNKTISINDGGFEIKADTFPYGFVDINAKVWFQKFLDDDSIEREYLCTEGYLWTSTYPECQRVIDHGNNQSMELDEKTLDGTWANQNNNSFEFFIINEAVISKLCILGEDVEPCFEGASIGGTEYSISLDTSFAKQLQYMLNEFKELLEGGKMSVDQNVKSELIENELTEGATVQEEPNTVEFKSKDEEKEEKSEEQKEPEGKEEKESKDDEDKKKKDYSELKEKYDMLSADYSLLEEEVKMLREFKAGIDRKEKQTMIDSFYMLSDEDKADVIKNIDTYSVDDIEAKLSVICVRNKVSFSKETEEAPIAYSVVAPEVEFSAAVPEWIQALRQTKAASEQE